VLFRDGDGRPVQIERPPVVPQPGPQTHDIARSGSGTVADRGKGLEECLVGGDDPIHLRLLQHDLADENAPWITGGAPREITPVCGTPLEQSALEPPDSGRRRRLSPRRRRRRGGGAPERALSSTP